MFRFSNFLHRVLEELLFIKDFVRDGAKQFVEKDPTVGKIRGWAGRAHPSLDKYFIEISSVCVALLVIFLFFYSIFWQAPSEFPGYAIATISKGEKLSEIADDLEARHMVQSSVFLKFFIIFVGGQRKIIAGDYYFEKPVNIFTVAHRLLKGDFGLTQIKIFIPEGLNVREMAGLFAAALPHFDKQQFIDEGEKIEGFLFPDTYFITPNENPSDIISLMKENFARKIEPFQKDLVKSGKSLEDVVNLASIVEDEARDLSDKRIVAGILWKRLRLGMPLQADSTLRYTTGKNSFQLTKDELADKKNPYNTYANKGLPPGPISSPGVDALRAAIAPTNTNYLYFLSDRNGHIHYAETFEQHKQNRELYLN